MRNVRTFLAIPFPAEVVQAAERIKNLIAPQLHGVRWVKPEAMHLTLRFFGHIPEDSLERIGEVMLSVGRSRAPFEVNIAGLGAFPSPMRPKVFWLGVRGDNSLSELYQDLDQGLTRIGFPGETRPFSPHLTLGRCQERLPDARIILEQYRDIACAATSIDRLVLFESRLRPSGAVHLPRKTVYLGPDSGISEE